MQLKNYKQSNRIFYFLILVSGCIIFWPLSLHVFSLKNDAVSYFLPFRYHISESVQHGHFPFWSPYLYTGLPLHSDIQSGVWNPVVLLISLVTAYDMNVLQAESLFYLLLSGISFYKLCREFNFERNICFVLGVSYMSSGFMIDSTSFIPWITSAAWLPFMFLYAHRLTQQAKASNAIKFALAGSLVFLSGYLSYFIFASFLLFLSAIGYMIHCYRTGNRKQARMFLQYFLFSVVIGAILCSPAIISYYEFLPYYRRGSGMSAAEASVNPFSWKNFISYFFPQPSYKIPSDNDISSRNAYIGIIPLVFLVYSFRYSWTMIQKWMAALTIVSLLFSLGNALPVRSLFYHTIPLMDTFRHPGTIRLFTNTGLLILCGYGWQHVTTDSYRHIKKILLLFLIIVCAGLITSVIYPGTWKELTDLFSNGWSRLDLKYFISVSSSAAWLFIGAWMQLFTLIACFFRKTKLMIPLSIANMFIMTFMSMPFTMVSQYRPSQVNQFIHRFPEGFPWDRAMMNVQDKINDSASFTKFGYEPFYTKRISLQDHLISPTINTSYNLMLHDTLLRAELIRHPFVYTNSTDSISVTAFSPNGFTISGDAKNTDTVFILQQYNHNWKATAGESSLPIHFSQKTFMSITVPKGTLHIVMEYRPYAVVIAACISLLFLVGCTGSLIYFRAIRL